MSDPTYPLTWPEALKAAKQGALIECSCISQPLGYRNAGGGDDRQAAGGLYGCAVSEKAGAAGVERIRGPGASG